MAQATGTAHSPRSPGRGDIGYHGRTLKEHKTARKTGQVRRIPVGRKLGELLNQTIGSRTEGPVFLGPSGRGWRMENLSRTYSRLRDEAGLLKDLVLYLARHECGTKVGATQNDAPPQHILWPLATATARLKAIYAGAIPRYQIGPGTTHVPQLHCSFWVALRSFAPLIQRRVRPNHGYGFRVRRTLEDPNLWYPANAYSGWWVLRVGVAEIVVAAALYFVPELNVALYASIVGVVGGVIIGLIQTFRYLHRLDKAATR